MKKNILALLAITVLLTFGMSITNPTAFQSSNELSDDITPNAEVNPGGQLTLPLEEFVESLNPLYSGETYDWIILERMFESLVTPNPYDPTNPQSYVGMLAKDWSREILEDQDVYVPDLDETQNLNVTVWNITLYEDYKWQDGETLTAEDVAFSYNFIYYTIVTGATDTWRGTIEVPDWIKCEVLDATHVEVYFNTTGYINSLLGLRTPYVFPQHIFSKASNWVDGASGTYNTWYEPQWSITAENVCNWIADSTADTPILTGSGPWIITEWNAESALLSDTFVFERNPNYYFSALDEDGNVIHDWETPSMETIDPYGPYLDKLVFNVITEESKEVASLKEGEIDMATLLGSYIPEVAAKGYTINSTPDFGHQEMYFECNQTLSGLWWTDEVVFRQAAGWAIDKEQIVSEVFQGYATPLDTFLSDLFSVWSWEDDAPYHMYAGNPSKGRDMILAKYGVENGGNVSYNASESQYLQCGGEPLSAEITVTNTPLNLQITSIIVNGLQTMGIKVTVNAMSWTSVINNLLADNYQLMRMGWGLSPEPFFIIDLAIGMSAGDVDWQNDTYDEYAIQMGNAPTYEDAVQYANKAMEIFFYEQPFVPLYSTQTISAHMKEDWEGVLSPLGASIMNTWTYRKAYHAPEEEEEEEEAGMPWLPIVGASVASAVVAGAIVWLVLRRRRPAE
ncbi:MAG: ABC transporter substrate-binding protein [Candidatus Korarchaeota archaeon]|nr:ABC transporter substrate-binding protein [Candidatus Korarchaeota archaeon]NIU83156.1 hypothetical protein [Candidatus Thorarchaeota archaeon]NIW13530.1 hypothetical protein [Candidatus Thorarchaeota archaeon]NIW51630.1 hypothetical protein [Candidatus Korarchaeota archaeon]